MMWDAWCSGTGLGWGGWAFSALFGLVVLTAFVFFAVWALRSLSGAGNTHGHGMAAGRPAGHGPRTERDPAETAARERFARGEISRSELEEIVRTLRE